MTIGFAAGACAQKGDVTARFMIVDERTGDVHILARHLEGPLTRVAMRPM
jgi:hypothetical protein